MSLESENDLPFEIFLFPRLKLILKEKMFTDVKKNFQLFLKLAEVKNRSCKQTYNELWECIEKAIF